MLWGEHMTPQIMASVYPCFHGVYIVVKSINRQHFAHGTNGVKYIFIVRMFDHFTLSKVKNYHA